MLFLFWCRNCGRSTPIVEESIGIISLLATITFLMLYSHSLTHSPVVCSGDELGSSYGRRRRAEGIRLSEEAADDPAKGFVFTGEFEIHFV